MAAVMRDMRSMNAMDEDTKRIHLRLESWAAAVGSDCINAWPKLTLLGRLIEQGPSGASQQGRPPVSMSHADSVVDAAVARLGDIDKRVIKSYYMHWESIEINAARLNMRVSQFRQVLKRARWRLSGYIDSKEFDNANRI